MPYITHRTELKPAKSYTSGQQNFNLMNEQIEARLDAGLVLRVLPPNSATPYHYHTGCEHYMFVISGQGELVLVDGAHPVATGFMISIDPEEHHALRNVGHDNLEILEFFIPGTGTTTILEE